jgi:hypothetical protein
MPRGKYYPTQVKTIKPKNTWLAFFLLISYKTAKQKPNPQVFLLSTIAVDINILNKVTLKE